MVVIVMIGTFGLVAALVPGGLAAMRDQMKAGGAAGMPKPTAPYLVGNLVLSFAAAMIGGWITLRLAPRAPQGHALALAAVVSVMGIVSAFKPGQSGPQPIWYKYVIPLVGIGGVALSVVLFA